MAADSAAKAAIDELFKSLSIDSIIGEPIEVGDKIILPVTKMGIFFGSGLKEAIGNRAEGRAGGGGSIFPVAIVIIFKDIRGPEGVRVIPLTKPSGQAELAESLTHMVSAAISKLGTRSNSSKGEPSHTAHAARIEIK